MSGSTTYNVILALSTTGNLGASLGSAAGYAQNADKALRSVGEGARRIGEGVAAAGERMGHALESVADKAMAVSAKIAGIGAAAGIGLAAYGVAKLNNNLEQTQISLGAIFQAQGFAPTFERGFSMASDQLAKMKQDVKTLPGDLGQLSDIMKMIATPAAQGGATPDAIRKMAGRTMLVGTILGVQQEVASREMANLLAGRAGAHNIFGSRMGLIGEEAQKFNKLAPEARLARINKELDKYSGAADRFGQSFIAQWTTLKDNIKYGMLAPATSGLFDRVKHAIGELNEYLDTHKEKVAEIASLVNRRLVGAWDYLEAKFKKIEPIVARIADRIAHMQPGAMATYLERAGAGMLATRGAGMALSGASSLLSAGLEYGGAAGAGTALGALANPAVLAGVAGGFVILGTAIVGVAGAVHALTDEASVFHDRAIELWTETAEIGEDALKSLKESASSLYTAILPLADTLGTDMLGAVRLLSPMLTSVSAGFELTGKSLNAVLEVIGHIPGFGAWAPSHGLASMGSGRGEHHWGEVVGKGGKGREGDASSGPISRTGAGGGGGGAHFYGEITIRVDGNNDPSRVARLTLEELKKLGRNPKRSALVPNYEAGNPYVGDETMRHR